MEEYKEVLNNVDHHTTNPGREAQVKRTEIKKNNSANEEMHNDEATSPTTKADHLSVTWMEEITPVYQ